MDDAFSEVGVPLDRGLAARLTPFVADAAKGRAKKNSTGTIRAPVPQTDTGRRGEYPQALERTVLKELGNLTP